MAPEQAERSTVRFSPSLIIESVCNFKQITSLSFSYLFFKMTPTHQPQEDLCEDYMCVKYIRCILQPRKRCCFKKWSQEPGAAAKSSKPVMLSQMVKSFRFSIFFHKIGNENLDNAKRPQDSSPACKVASELFIYCVRATQWNLANILESQHFTSILSKGSRVCSGWEGGHLKQESPNKPQKMVWTRDNEKAELYLKRRLT